MKTTKFLAVGFIALSIYASSVFAVMRPPYPQKTTAPDTIIIITTDDRHDSVHSTLRPSNNHQ